MGIVLLSPTKKEGALSLPLIEFNFLSPNIEISEYDLLIFTSKTAVKGIDNITNQWKRLPSITVGEKTAKEVKKFGGLVSFIGNGYGDSIINEILKHKKKKLLFIRGKEVATNLKEITKKELPLNEIIVYETLCKKEGIKLEDSSIIIFTSPSSVKCFFKNYKWKDSYKAVAIGKTTAKELPADIKVYIPTTPTFEHCIDLAKRLQ